MTATAEHPDVSPYVCGLDAAMAVVGAKWKPLILWALVDGPRRFGELQRELPEISRKMLTQHLRELAGHGVVLRQDFHEMPPRVEYSLTAPGKRLVAALEPLGDWAVEHIDVIRVAPGTGHGRR
jgi:DNA-binding HxlR family transcriptional regulator